MSEEIKKDELDENELWDLLKEPVETERKKTDPAPKKAAKPVEEKSGEITEKRKKSLVMYLAGLFGIAFIAVLVSLLFKGGSNDDALIQVEALQQQVQQLQQENAQLQDEKETLSDNLLTYQMQIEDLNNLIIEMSTESEYIEGNFAMANGENEEMGKTYAAYENLVAALNAMMTYDEDALNQALTELETQSQYLSGNALNAYYMVMEYMEQPYWGEQYE